MLCAPSLLVAINRIMETISMSQNTPNNVRRNLQYLARLDEWDDVKPFQIVGTLNPGQPRENFKFETHSTTIYNARSSGHSEFSLGTCGFEWVKHETKEDLSSTESIDRYILEVSELVRLKLNAKMVKPYQYQIRDRDRDGSDLTIRLPSGFIHIGERLHSSLSCLPLTIIDVTPEAARNRVKHSFPNHFDRILGGGFRFLSIWRPLFGPVKDNTLALCDSRSINDEDLIESDHIYPDFESETYMAFFAPGHKWYYLEDQMPDEVLLITNYDSSSETRVLHSGFDLQAPGQYEKGRQSIEVKIVVAD
ncbi:hypothetical protein V495_06712 [Pseudogymnoascus sp. VKM F-4514 (FW-929)]|nr:hypothetical protein V495_06712 [Pseudogymnoascus sp. VKM F-4514 (FW-929)]KFY62226.1 hypothetical protein V497_02499 [Pseudogymnoascus sp. VKM F-4516 (FW-969)]